MTYVLVTAPATEPISTADAKLHARIDISDDDAYVDALVTTAREYVEHETRRALITQTWDLWLDDWPDDDTIIVGKPPLQSVTHVKYVTDDGATATMSSSDYWVDTHNEPGRVRLKGSASWPSATLRELNGVNVRFVAGYGTAPTSVPGLAIQAMKLLIGHWYENREQVIVSGAVPKEMPMAAKALLAPLRVYRWV